jgi:enoyl-[acyl-carrier protein] reductase/trans-2-enoyl-CoA reductase (NAD+)
MGGEDWQFWIEALDEAGVLADGARTTAYTYIGEQADLGHLLARHDRRRKEGSRSARAGYPRAPAARGGDARVSVLKAVVTQASAAIPAMPIYLAILFKVMKERGTHEGCIEQIDGLFRESLYGDTPHTTTRAACAPMARNSTRRCRRRWASSGRRSIRTTCDELSDFDGYRREFLQLFGFEVDGVDYDADVDPVVPIAQLV